MTTTLKRAPNRTKPALITPTRKLTAARGKTSSHRPAEPAKKPLAEINRWMENSVDMVMKVARRNTLHLTGKEEI